MATFSHLYKRGLQETTTAYLKLKTRLETWYFRPTGWFGGEIGHQNYETAVKYLWHCTRAHYLYGRTIISLVKNNKFCMKFVYKKYVSFCLVDLKLVEKYQFKIAKKLLDNYVILCLYKKQCIAWFYFSQWCIQSSTSVGVKGDVTQDAPIKLLKCER